MNHETPFWHLAIILSVALLLPACGGGGGGSSSSSLPDASGMENAEMPDVFTPGLIELLEGEVDDTITGYFAPGAGRITSPKGDLWGYWAKDPEGHFLFAIETDSDDPNSNLHYWGHESGSRPSTVNSSGTLTWTGKIRGSDFDGDDFKGDISLSMDLDAADPDLLDIALTNITLSALIPSSLEYSDVAVGADGSIDHHIGGDMDNRIEAKFYGDEHEGIAGSIADRRSGYDIDFGMFGAVRTE